MFKYSIILIAAAGWLAACQTAPGPDEADAVKKETYALLGYATEAAWGEHLVTVLGCDDCHSPKVMTEMGPAPNPERRLSGHPAGAPTAALDRAAIEGNGYGACDPNMTSWMGPWGISYAGNITPHATGIGNWSKEQFASAVRQGWYKGLEGGRMLLPPMPVPGYAHMTDAEVSAIYAYLMTVPPVDNIVPMPTPPLAAAR